MCNVIREQCTCISQSVSIRFQLSDVLSGLKAFILRIIGIKTLLYWKVQKLSQCPVIVFIPGKIPTHFPTERPK